VVEAGGPWGVAALDRLAGWVYGFAEEVDSIEPPLSLQGEAVKNFRLSLKSVSEPLRTQAVQAWKSALDRVGRLGILSPYTPWIADRLADRKVRGVSRAQGFRDKYRLTGISADGGVEGRAVALERTRARLLRDTKDLLAWVDYGNLLWGEGKPLLARISYERALLLDQKQPTALNNLGVLILSGTGQEDWYRSNEAETFFREALRKDELYLAARFNLGALYSYYRVFTRSKTYWSQVLSRAPGPDAWDGLAISHQGLGEYAKADSSFRKAKEFQAASKRFAAVFHEAAMVTDPKKCLSILGRIDPDTIQGFEKESYLRLQRACERWRAGK
jgi:tetratricopeptide (TPR) repeat protein